MIGYCDSISLICLRKIRKCLGRLNLKYCKQCRNLRTIEYYVLMSLFEENNILYRHLHELLILYRTLFFVIPRNFPFHRNSFTRTADQSIDQYKLMLRKMVRHWI